MEILEEKEQETVQAENEESRMKEYIVAFTDDADLSKFEMLHGTNGELIRCKDCKYWDGYYCHNKWWGDGYSNYTPPVKTEEGYCDWAEMDKEWQNIKE